MLRIYFHLKDESSGAVERDLALVRAISVVRLDPHDIDTVGPFPVQQVSNTDRRWPSTMRLVQSHYLNFLSIITIDQQVSIDVHQLNREQICGSSHYSCNISVSHGGIGVKR